MFRMETAMNDDPVELDGRRTAAGQVGVDHRRHALKKFQADQEALRRRQHELEAQLLAEPSANWVEAAVKAEYLIRLYAATLDGADARRKDLVERALMDLARLTEQEKRDSPPPSDG